MGESVFLSQLSGLLDQLVEISSMFEQGVINEEERNDRSRNILAELNLLLETDRQRISPRGNSARSTKVVRLQRIVRILEGNEFCLLCKSLNFCKKQIFQTLPLCN